MGGGRAPGDEGFRLSLRNSRYARYGANATSSDAEGELSTAQIVTALLVVGGHGEGTRRAMAPRVRGNLAYLERRGAVAKSGTGRDARWALA